MKANEIEPGQVFIFGPVLSRPKLKLKEGFLDMISRYTYACWGDKPATVLTETQIHRLRQIWGMTEGGFGKFRRALIEGHSKI